VECHRLLIPHILFSHTWPRVPSANGVAAMFAAQASAAMQWAQWEQLLSFQARQRAQPARRSMIYKIRLDLP
jgi:hypothetical protein